jgi:hypothetical protein
MWGAAPGLTGGLFVYPEPALSLDASDGSMMVGGEVADYSGFGVWFTSCIDASAYSGLSFDISGDVGPSATIKIGLQTNGDFPVDVLGMKGACTFATEATKYTECVTPIVAKDVPESGGTITVAWSEFAGGKPVATADPSEIVGIEWSFSWAGPSDTAYEADVTVDNLRFLGEDSGGGGAPGAGGNGAEPGAGGEGGA